MITKELEMIINLALQEASGRQHDLLCLEHIIYVMLDNPQILHMLEDLGVDVAKFRQSLDAYLSISQGSSSTIKPHYPTGQTLAVGRVLKRAAVHVESAGKMVISPQDLLAAVYLERDSYVVYLLESYGVTRLDLLQYISHVEPQRYRAEVDNESSDTFVREQAPLKEGGLEPIAENFTSLPADDEEKLPPAGELLRMFTTDLVAKAQAGGIDPLIGRKDELTRILHILSRRRKNNPLLLGEPGVGKTALVEGLALAIFEKKVPELLAKARIFALDMGALIAGTKFRGEFEQRLKMVLKAIKNMPQAIIFIDEIHTIVGAGSVNGGSLDASNILKPLLASGEIRCIGSTTYKEFQNTFERDRALARRFAKVELPEPSLAESVQILKGLKKNYEDYHQVVYTDQALEEAVALSAKYITDRHLPDKAIDVLDEIGAKMRLLPAGKRPKIIKRYEVEKIIAKMAKIPTKTVSLSDKERLQTLARDLKQVIFGQEQAIDDLVAAIKLARAGLGAAERPIGSFLFAGPTGVGKTELARQLAKLLGVELLRFDMSEYMEKHTISRLIGAPPGYVGFDQGGLLTDAVLKHPYAVVILDEIEKAHYDLFNILLQVMDHATLTDNNGRKADFRNVILIMTTNAGAREMEALDIGFTGNTRDTSAQNSAAKGPISKMFTPEFRNRLDGMLIFRHLTTEVVALVVTKLFQELVRQLEPKKVKLTLTPEAKSFLVKHGYDRSHGARPLGRLLAKTIRLRLAEEILFGSLQKGGEALVCVEEEELKVKVTGHN